MAEHGVAPARRLSAALRSPWALPAAWLLVLAIAWIVRLVAQGTYPNHMDEAHLARRALRILYEGDPNPHWFRYGSLPIYLTTAGMWLGALIAHAQGSLADIHDVWSVAAPYYSDWVVMFVPKLLFLLIALGGVWCAGLLGSALSPDPLARLLPMVVLGCAPLYGYHAVAYLNVDVIAAVLVLAALALLARSHRSTRFLPRVLWPGLACGAVIATKYNSGLLVLPFALLLLQERRYLWLACFALATALAFLAFQPFVLVEPARWLDDMQFELHHYQSGHPGWEDDPGLPQLRFYLGVLRDNFGWPLCACALLGVRAALHSARRATWSSVLFPLALLAFMATNRVHFARSVLPAIAVLAVFMALGAAWCTRASRTLALRVIGRAQAVEGFAAWLNVRWRELLSVAVAGVSLLVLLAPVLFGAIARAAAPVHDSRVRIARFIAGRASAPCQVIVPVQMRIDPSALGGPCEVVAVNLRNRGDVLALLERSGSLAHAQRYVVYAPFIEDRGLSRMRAIAWRQVLASADPSTPLLEAGSQPVMLWQRTLDVRDPKLSVYRLR